MMNTLETAASAELDPLVELTNISKSFGRVYALEGINLKLYPGEIVSLVGDNGAGKSTLTKIISGIEQPDSGGRITIDGNDVRSWNAAKARNLGIETVHQSRALSEQQTIYDNVFMGRERTNALGFVKRKEEIAETEALLRRIGYTSKVWTPTSTVNKLSGGERQGVAIARAILFNSRLVLLDEPTTAMALSEVGEVMEFIVDLKQQGKSVIFISHNPWDAHAVADRFVVLDRGRVVFDGPKGNMSSDEFVRLLKDSARGKVQQ
jgi:simple sugar transport system ATP-binding protein